MGTENLSVVYDDGVRKLVSCENCGSEWIEG